MFSSNHIKLIRDVYPPDLTTADPLPSPSSNHMGKLTFYAAGRPKKLPKVAAVLLERAEKDGRANSGAKGRGGLAVTIDILKGLVAECRTELRCFADQALRAVELGLTRREGQRRDVQLEARAASLFHAIATFTTGPFLGLNDALGKQYLLCLSLVSSLAQLSSEHTHSRAIALDALKGAVSSELLYSQTAAYDSQIEEIMPALLYNCLNVPIEELHQQSNVSDATAEISNLGPVSSRKSPSIEPPAESPSPVTLASSAVTSLRAISRLSHGVQLSFKLTAMGSWLDRYKNGVLWEQSEFIEWLGSSGIAASPVQYRAGVVGWWVDQVVEIDDTKATTKSETLLRTLAHILSGPTSLVGLGIGSVLSQLTSLIVQRASLGDEDPLFSPLLATISSLASSHIYYVDQLNDVVADLVDSIRSVKEGSAVAARLGRGERKRAMRQLVGALRQVLVEAEKGDEEVKVAVPLNGSSSNGTNGTTAAEASTPKPPLPENSEGTIRGNGVLLGVGQAEGIKSKKEGPSSLDAMGRPIMRVAGAGRRSRISPEVFQDSLFLLTDADATIRDDYERALLVYLEKEMDVGLVALKDEPTLDPSHEIARFCRELHLAIYELATSPTLGSDTPNFSLAGHQSSTVNPSRSRSSSLKSSRRLSASSRLAEANATATAADYAALAAIVEAVQLRRSAEAVMEGAPVLVALERSAKKWEGEVQGAERAQACSEIAARGLGAIGDAWGIAEVRRIADEALSRMAPSVLPPFDAVRRMAPNFAASPSAPWPAIATAAVDAVLGSRSLQSAAGTGLGNVLHTPWTPQVAHMRDSTVTPAYPNSGRSITNLGSTLRVTSASTPERAASFRAPSLADLQSSLGRPGSIRTSATPSIASTSGNTIATHNTQRRTVKAKADIVLSRLTVSRGGSRASSIHRSPPYAAAAN